METTGESNLDRPAAVNRWYSGIDSIDTFDSSLILSRRLGQTSPASPSRGELILAVCSSGRSWSNHYRTPRVMLIQKDCIEPDLQGR
jgi:hypothetical protein